MKKRLLIIFILFSTFTFVCACQKKYSLNIYEYSSIYDSSIVFNYTGLDYDDGSISAYSNDEIAGEHDFTIKGILYKMKYMNTDKQEFLSYEKDNYKNNDGLSISCKKNTDEIVGISSYTGIDMGSIDQSKTQNSFQKLADTIMSDYIVINDYNCSCNTMVTGIQKNNDGTTSSIANNYDYFYEKEKEIEVCEYKFTYMKMIDGYPSSDAAIITINEEGKVLQLYVLDICAFENKSYPDLSEQDVEKIVNNKLSESCRTDYRIIENTNQLCYVMGSDKKPVILVTTSTKLETETKGIFTEETGMYVITIE